MVAAYLIGIGCDKDYVCMSDESLSTVLGFSPQIASACMAEMEEQGMIEKIITSQRYLVRITGKGHDTLTHLVDSLSSVLYREPDSMRVYGTVASGMGQAASYLSLPGYVSQFQSMLGMTPFPGTLNIQLYQASARQVDKLNPDGGTLVSGFEEDNRTYGWARCYKALLYPDMDCYLVRLERTHHLKDTVELVAPYNLRRRANLIDGSLAIVSVDQRSDTIKNVHNRVFSSGH